jgi:hypothetical protein
MPSIENVRAVITMPWGKKGYKPKTINAIESYYVDTALDNDSDPFQLEIGDPDGDMIKALKRNNEVRVQIFGVGSKARGLDYLFTGVADEISYDERGVMRLMGRDLSSLATDSTVPPKHYRHARAWKIVEKQARELGIGGRLNLSHDAQVKKLQVTDGSESYWEFWHRLYRKEQMWIWMGPQGYLNAQKLHYDAAPSYFFGKPKADDPSRIKELYIPTENVEIRKTTQGRVGEVWVYGHRGDNGFLIIAEDTTMNHWIKKPRKILYSKEAHDRRAAYRIAWEEIFEGKVGSVEIRVTIGDPGFLVRMNSIARIRIPEMNLFGDYFVVGTRVQAGQSGFVQEVRLREKDYALTRKIPPSPKLDTQQPDAKDADVAGVNLSGIPYAAQFIKAAKEFHGPWNFQLFLATLIAIGDQETGGAFIMERANGGPGEDHVAWYRWEPAAGQKRKYADDPYVPKSERVDKFGRTEEEWKTIFANEPGQYVSQTFAVGIMQLYTLGFKWWADDYLRLGHRNQFYGGRWDAESNIRAGARALRAKLQSAVRDSGRDIDMWAGVSYYGHHYADETPNTVPTKYAVSVKNKVFNVPGYLQQVKDAFTDAAKSAKDPDNADAYVNPFKDSATINAGRVDHGVDYSGTGDICAIGKARIIGDGGTNSGWPGGHYLVYKLLDGEWAGKYIFLAEGIHPIVHRGEKVQAGEKIAVFRNYPDSTSIEHGWSSESGTLNKTRASERGDVHLNSPPGLAFARFLRSLGAPLTDKAKRDAGRTGRKYV